MSDYPYAPRSNENDVQYAVRWHRWVNEQERPDADEDADDSDVLCEGPCKLPTDFEDLWLTAQGDRLCARCYFETWRSRNDA